MVIANTLFQQHKRWLYTWIPPNGQYWNQIDDILCSRRWRSSMLSAKTRPGTEHPDHQFLIAKFRLKLKRVGKTTRLFRYDLNQIPYGYTVEVTNRFQWIRSGRQTEKLWMEVHNVVRRLWPKPPQRKRNSRMQSGCPRRLYTELRKEEKQARSNAARERYTQLNAEFQRIARGDMKAFLSDQCKEIEENNRIGKTRDLFKEIRDTKGTVHAKMGSIKDRNVWT